ncbi:MAG TPA: hypothetical protein VIY30_05630 [Burkholderiaceae bacterium]
MTAPATLNAIAIDVVGHYGQTAKNLVATYRTTTERAVSALGARYEQLVDSKALPWLKSEIKANLVDSKQRLSRLVMDSVARIAERTNGAVDRVSDRTVQGIEAFGEQTAWANDMMVVNAIRKINLPVARLSLGIAGRVDDASRRLSQRVAATATTKTTKTAKTAVKRARRAVRAK